MLLILLLLLNLFLPLLGPSPGPNPYQISVVPTFNSLDMNHARDIAELELAEETVEDLEVFMDVFRVVGCGGEALREHTQFPHPAPRHPPHFPHRPDPRLPFTTLQSLHIV